MASFCRPGGRCHGGFMPQMDPRQMHDIFANVLTSMLNAPGRHQQAEDWTRKVLIPSSFTVDEIDISVSGKELKITGNKDDESLEVSINIPEDVNVDALSTKWLKDEHSVVIIGPREQRPQVDSDHVKAQMDAWMEDAKDFMHEVVSRAASDAEDKSTSTPATSTEKNERHLNVRKVAKERDVTEPEVHRVKMEVNGFHPDEIAVVTKGTKVTVTGYHVRQSGEDCEEKRMKRTFTFPDGADLKKISWAVDRQSQMLEVFAPLM